MAEQQQPETIDDQDLRGYLGETLPQAEMARIERKLRQDAQLRDRLETIRLSREADPYQHTLGAIWRRRRLTCFSREKLGSFLHGVLEQAETDYLQFHVQVVQCPFCSANLADLREKLDLSPSTRATPPERKARYFHSSRSFLPGTPNP